MKKKIILLIFLFISMISYSQIFKSKNDDSINLNSKEITINIDNTFYEGKFQNFTSKKDKKEYLIYRYFSRSIIIELNKRIDDIDEKSPTLVINRIKLIHTSDLNSVMKVISKRGFNDIKDFIIVYESPNIKLDLINQNSHLL